MAQSPVSLPQALLNRRRKIEEESGPGPDEDGRTPGLQQPPREEPPTPLQEPPAQTPTPQPQNTPPAPEPEGAPEEFDLETDVDLVSALTSMTQGEEPQSPPSAQSGKDRGAIERERQQLKEEREALAAERAAWERDRARAQQPAAPSITGVEADPTLLDKYKPSAPAIKHYALEAIKDQMNPILSDIAERLAKLESDTNEVVQTATRAESQVKTMSDRQFNTEISKVLGDIRPLFSNDRFAAFLNRRPPYMPDKTLRTLLHQALDARQPAPVISIVQAFAKSEAAAGRPIESMRVGRATGGTQKRLPSKGRSGTLPWSDRQKAWNDFRSGVISRDKFNEIKTQYEEAEAKGLVDYDS